MFELLFEFDFDWLDFLFVEEEELEEEKNDAAAVLAPLVAPDWSCFVELDVVDAAAVAAATAGPVVVETVFKEVDDEDMTDEAFCDIADNAAAAMFALCWALEAIVFTFLVGK